jgi:hypothetical protein
MWAVLLCQCASGREWQLPKAVFNKFKLGRPCLAASSRLGCDMSRRARRVRTVRREFTSHLKLLRNSSCLRPTAVDSKARNLMLHRCRADQETLARNSNGGERRWTKVSSFKFG